MMNLFEYLTNVKNYGSFDAFYVNEVVKQLPDFRKHLSVSENLDLNDYMFYCLDKLTLRKIVTLLDNSNT